MKAKGSKKKQIRIKKKQNRGIKKKTNKDQKKTNKDQKKQIRTIVVKIVKKLRKGRIKKKTNGNTYE